MTVTAVQVAERARELLNALGFPGGGWDMDWPETPQVLALFDICEKAEGREVDNS